MNDHHWKPGTHRFAASDAEAFLLAIEIASMPVNRSVTGSFQLVWTASLIGICMLCLIGCQLTSPAGEGTESKTPETVWTILADYVNSGDVTDSSKLELIVKRLRAHQDIDDAALNKFYSAFPGIQDKERSLTADDAKSLRGL